MEGSRWYEALADLTRFGPYGTTDGLLQCIWSSDWIQFRVAVCRSSVWRSLYLAWRADTPWILCIVMVMIYQSFIQLEVVYSFLQMAFIYVVVVISRVFESLRDEGSVASTMDSMVLYISVLTSSWRQDARVQRTQRETPGTLGIRLLQRWKYSPMPLWLFYALEVRHDCRLAGRLCGHGLITYQEYQYFGISHDMETDAIWMYGRRPSPPVRGEIAVVDGK